MDEYIVIAVHNDFMNLSKNIKTIYEGKLEVFIREHPDLMVFYHNADGIHGGAYYGFSGGSMGTVKLVGDDYIPIMRKVYLKGKSTLMIYDRHPELQSKWDKSFWARGY